LVCTAVVNGLNNFQVGFPSVLPTAGSAVQTDSYPVCGVVEVGVTVGLVLKVTCPISIAIQQYRYVIIQSLDTSAEKLCIAEVCVDAASQYAVRYVRIVAATKLHITPFLSASDC